MAITLAKTWRKDSMLQPDVVSSTHDSNRWILWAIKEMLLLGSDGIKGGPNAWTVVGSCDSTQFAMDGTDYLVSYANMISSTGNHSWIVLRNAGLGGGSGVEVCFDFTDDTSYSDELTLAYSYSAGFAGGSLSARPTATDEYEVIFESNSWPGSSSSRRRLITRLMSTDGESYRLLVQYDGTLNGALFFEKIQNPASWVDENFLLWVGGLDLNLSRLCTGEGYFFRNNGVNCRARGARLGSKSSYGISQYFASQNGTTGLDMFGNYQLMPFLAHNITAPNYGILGTLADMYVVEATLPLGYLFPHSGGANGLICYGNFAFGNDGTPGFFV